MKMSEILNENPILTKALQIGSKAIPKAGPVGQTAKDALSFLGSAARDVSSSVIRRSGSLALQGRTQEAENLIRSTMRSADPATVEKVLDFVRSVKPIPNATSAKLDANPQVTDWINNKYLPWVQQYIK